MSLSGSNFQRPADPPTTLSNLIRSRVDRSTGSQYIEIDRAGQRVTKTTAELYGRAMEILPQLRKRISAGDSDIVLCFESVLDFVPAAWACIFGGYACVPCHMPKLSNEKEIRSRLQVLGRKLNNPVLVTNKRIIKKIESVESWPGLALSLDQDCKKRFSATSGPKEESTVGATGGAFLMPTSGTTGSPKIAVLEHHNLLGRFLSTPERSAGQRRISCFPFDSVSCLWVIFPGQGDTVFIQPDYLAAQPFELLKIAADFQVKTLALSTSMAARIYEAEKNVPGRCDLSSLDHVGFGGEMIVPSVILKFCEKLRQMGAHDLEVSLGYGMTETGLICRTNRLTLHQLADHLNQDVSVGSPAAGCSLRVVDDAGNACLAGAAGNIEVWSDTKLFTGYRNDVELTKTSFAEDGWFKTGDIGIAAPEGLIITGRLKATIIINARNITLESIEAPARQMDGIFGSLVAAAPVRFQESATEELALFFVPQSKEIIDDLCRRLVRETACNSGVNVRHLVPLKLAEFPLTSAGKVRRDILVEFYQSGKFAPYRLLPADSTNDERSLTESQRRLMELWQRVLELVNAPGLHDNFFELGGDSLASVQLIASIEEMFSCDVPLETLFECPTIAAMDALLKKRTKKLRNPSVVQSPLGSVRPSQQRQSLVTSREDMLQSSKADLGSTTPTIFESVELCSAKAAGWPLYCLPMASGSLDHYIDLARIISRDRPVYGIAARGNNWSPFESLQALAASAVARLLDKHRLDGPAYLLGYSFGGHVAIEAARQLAEYGVVVPLVVIADQTANGNELSLGRRIRHFTATFGPWAVRVGKRYTTDAKHRINYRDAIHRKLKGQHKFEHENWYQRLSESRQRFITQNLANVGKYRFDGVCRSKILLLRSSKPKTTNPFRPTQPQDYGWGRMTGAPVDVVNVPGEHNTIMEHPNVAYLGGIVRQALNDCDRNVASTVVSVPEPIRSPR